MDDKKKEEMKPVTAKIDEEVKKAEVAAKETATKTEKKDTK